MKRIVVALLVLWASLARAQDADETRHTYRAVVDRVDLEPGTLTGLRLRVYLSALSIGGQRLDLTDPKSIKLYLGPSELKQPFALGTYDGTKGDTAVIVLVQSTLDYADVLLQISDSLDHDLMTSLPDSTQFLVLPYGETVSTGKLKTVKDQRGKVALSTDNSVSDPALLDTLDRALSLLKKAKTEPEGRALRKLIVVIGDGRDMAADRDRVTRTGQRAAKEGVRIHTIAFSAADVRRPMLLLGELSKQSLGTFRWVRKATPDSWKAAFEQLREEITKQYVLTYFVGPDDDVGGKKLHITTVGRTETTSNEVKVPPPSCGSNECTADYCSDGACMRYKADGGRGIGGWLLLIGGIAVGGIVVLYIIGVIITKRQQRPVAPMYPGMQSGMQPGMYPGMQPGMQMPPGVQPGGQVPGSVPPASTKKSRWGKKAAAPAAAAVAPGLLPNGRPIPALLIMTGPRTGERHLLHNGYLIGKQPGCHLIIEDGFTSSQHAQIGMDTEGGCKLYDRGSTNGTYINGNRITEMALQHGCTIRIGSTEMMFLAQ